MAMELIETTEAITTEAELKTHLINISKSDPKFVFAACVTWGRTRIFKGKNRSSVGVDSPQSRTMLNAFGGVCFQDGKLLQPTASWLKRNNKIPMRD
jgi:hypothetical protein